MSPPAGPEEYGVIWLKLAHTALKGLIGITTDQNMEGTDFSARSSLLACILLPESQE